MSLWERVIEAVDAHAAHDDIGNAILQAAFLFEKARASPELQESREYCANQGWTPEVEVATVDLDARDRTVDSLKRLATVRPDDANIASVYWALGKGGDVELRQFFTEALRWQLHQNPDAVFQILIALDKLGEPAFGDRRSRSIRDVEKNYACAEEYLAGLND